MVTKTKPKAVRPTKAEKRAAEELAERKRLALNKVKLYDMIVEIRLMIDSGIGQFDCQVIVPSKGAKLTDEWSGAISSGVLLDFGYSDGKPRTIVIGPESPNELFEEYESIVALAKEDYAAKQQKEQRKARVLMKLTPEQRADIGFDNWCAPDER